MAHLARQIEDGAMRLVQRGYLVAIPSPPTSDLQSSKDSDGWGVVPEPHGHSPYIWSRSLNGEPNDLIACAVDPHFEKGISRQQI